MNSIQMMNNLEYTIIGCVPLLQDHFSKTLLLPYNPNFPLSITVMPKTPNPNSQKVVVWEMDLEKRDTTQLSLIPPTVYCGSFSHLLSYLWPWSMSNVSDWLVDFFEVRTCRQLLLQDPSGLDFLLFNEWYLSRHKSQCESANTLPQAKKRKNTLLSKSLTPSVA